MECVELAPAVGCVARFESGSKLHALHTLRAVWFRLCRPGDRRALPALLLRHYSPHERFIAHGTSLRHDLPMKSLITSLVFLGLTLRGFSSDRAQLDHRIRKLTLNFDEMQLK